MTIPQIAEWASAQPTHGRLCVVPLGDHRRRGGALAVALVLALALACCWAGWS